MSFHDCPVIPSIIAKDEHEFNERMMRISFSHTIHIDVMDGEFVPNISFDRHEHFTYKYLEHFRKVEVHLMAVDPKHWIDYMNQVTDVFIIPAELPNAKELIAYIKSVGSRAGIAINPDTQLESLTELLPLIDHITVMTVVPGKYGATFIENTLRKVTQLRRMYPKYDIECDGGMNERTVASARRAGANLFVAGSVLQTSHNPQHKFDLLFEIIKSIE